MRVSEAMHTPAVVCRPTATLHEVARLMDARSVGCVLVVDETDRVTGLVTDRDLALRALGKGRSADIPVAEVMTRDVAAVVAGSDISEAATIMQKRAVRRVPVVDEDGRPHGMVTLDDLFRHLGHETDTLTDTLLAQVARLRSMV